MAKMIALQQLGARMYATVKAFSDDRFTGQVQFHVTYNQGGVSRANLITQSAFGYSEESVVRPPGQPPSTEPAQEEQVTAHKGPPIGLIAHMSRKE